MSFFKSSLEALIWFFRCSYKLSKSFSFLFNSSICYASIFSVGFGGRSVRRGKTTSSSSLSISFSSSAICFSLLSIRSCNSYLDVVSLYFLVFLFVAYLSVPLLHLLHLTLRFPYRFRWPSHLLQLTRRTVVGLQAARWSRCRPSFYCSIPPSSWFIEILPYRINQPP